MLSDTERAGNDLPASDIPLPVLLPLQRLVISISPCPLVQQVSQVFVDLFFHDHFLLFCRSPVSWNFHLLWGWLSVFPPQLEIIIDDPKNPWSWSSMVCSCCISISTHSFIDEYSFFSSTLLLVSIEMGFFLIKCMVIHAQKKSPIRGKEIHSHVHTSFFSHLSSSIVNWRWHMAPHLSTELLNSCGIHIRVNG